MLTVGLLYLLVLKAPGLYAQFKSEGTMAKDFSVPLSTGEVFNLQDLKTKKVVVFWATWCPPCEIELSRINDMIKDQKISADSVLAISISEDKQTVDKVASERGYVFPIGYDINGEVAAGFNVAGTPTIIFLEADKTLNWITTGLSPLLTVRLNMFLD